MNELQLIGVFDCKLDAKHRLMVPSQLRKQLTVCEEQGFVIKKSVFQNCLEIYPKKEWDVVMSKVNKLNRFVKKNNDFIRVFTAGVRLMDLDSSGRWQVPKDLSLFAGLKKEVVVASTGNMVELWSKEQYETSIDMDADSFANLAEEVMGGEDELS